MPGYQLDKEDCWNFRTRCSTVWLRLRLGLMILKHWQGNGTSKLGLEEEIRQQQLKLVQIQSSISAVTVKHY